MTAAESVNEEAVALGAAAAIVEIGGQTMTQAQYDAARFPLLNEPPELAMRGDEMVATFATDEAVEAVPLAYRREGGHWLVFGKPRPGPIVGCHCGFTADTDTDSGYGDSVLIHFEAVVRAEALANARLSDVPHLERRIRESIAGEVVEWARAGRFTPYGDVEGEVLGLAAEIKRGQVSS